VLDLIARRLRGGDSVQLVVTSASMAPFLLPGDCIKVRAITDRPVRPGDLVLAHRLPRPLVHRVVACQCLAGERRFTTKGDNATQCDAPLANAELLGRVYQIDRGCRQLALQRYLAHGNGVALAWLSRLQCRSAGVSPPLARRLAVRGLRAAMRAGAWLTWRFASYASPQSAAQQYEEESAQQQARRGCG